MFYKYKLRGSSQAIVLGLESGLGRIGLLWLILASLACAARLATGSTAALPTVDMTLAAAPYLFVISMPVASLLLADRWFRDPDRTASSFPLWRSRHWRGASLEELRGNPSYGVAGVMAALLVGLLLNIPLRVGEFLMAVPALGTAPPAWFAALHRWMLLDTVLLTSAYAVTFVAALRRMPVFPRLLVAVWTLDLAMQLAIARGVATAGPLPPEVEVALQSLLTGNMKKVLISVSIWLPYLILSRRVNATYRRRLPL